MYEFTKWCFLCASDKNVNVNIKSLEEVIREHIGQFSIINFTLNGAPSSICDVCHAYLVDYERRKERFANVEKMYCELLKLKNKPVDLHLIKSKYGLLKKDDETHHQKDVEQIEIIEYATDDEDISESHVTFIAKPSSPTCKTERPSQRRPSVKLTGSNLKRNDISSPVASSSPPIILNHLFGPKIVSNNRNDLYWCDLCSNSCSTKFSLERHMRQVHHNKSARSFACEFCSKTFAKKVILQNHQKIHSEYRPTVTCELCGKVLSSATALASHIRWLHCDQREFKCGNCSKMFATKGAATEHQKTHLDLKGHICPVCKKSYKTASTLTQHLDTHSGTEYHCIECGLRLNSKRTLKQHMLKHSDVCKYTCEMCNAKFKRSKAFKEHLIAVHTKIRAYTCDWCEKTFSNGANCRKHKKEAHANELREKDKNQTTKQVQLPKIKELLTSNLVKKKP